MERIKSTGYCKPVWHDMKYEIAKYYKIMRKLRSRGGVTQCQIMVRLWGHCERLWGCEAQ